MPIFIPELSGYFEQAPRLLDLTLESLRRSTAGRANVTLIANECVPSVLKRLQEEREKGWLDQLLINRENRGKADALRSAMHGCFESLITVSDGDVLFHQGWLEAVHETFCVFPEAASVSPSPNPNTAWVNAATTVVGAFLRGELGYRAAVTREDLDRFADSLENPGFYSESAYRSQLSVERRGTVACVGNGHFCVTVRREVLAEVPREPSQTALDPSADHATLDDPPELIGGWKLATAKAWVTHLGNVEEPWMAEQFDVLVPPIPTDEALPSLNRLPPFRASWLAALPLRSRRLGAKLVRKLVRKR